MKEIMKVIAIHQDDIDTVEAAREQESILATKNNIADAFSFLQYVEDYVDDDDDGVEEKVRNVRRCLSEYNDLINALETAMNVYEGTEVDQLLNTAMYNQMDGKGDD